MSSQVWGLAEYIEISAETPFLSLPSFGREGYELSKLHSGHKAEIISLNSNHLKGVSLQVRIAQGPQKGQMGWVYLPENEAQRTMSILNRQNEPLDLPSNSFKEHFSSFSKTMSPTSTNGIVSKIPELVDVKTDDELWDQFLAGKLQMTQGQDLVTLKDPETRKTYQVSPSLKVAATLGTELQSVAQSAGEVDCEEEKSPIQQRFARKEKSWLKGCEVLAQKVDEAQRTKLGLCFNSIKSVLSEGKKLTPNDRSQVFSDFYKKLNPVEQEFLASMVTSIGEAGVLAPPVEEMVAIMMVLKNRKEDAQSKGFPDANMLDTALQSMQFSMYNKGAHHWSDALNRSNSDAQTQHALDAFIKFKNLKITSNSPLKDVFHYHTDKVAPKWKSPSSVLKMVLDGVKLKESGARHIFYKNIGWSFKHNPWSQK